MTLKQLIKTIMMANLLLVLMLPACGERPEEHDNTSKERLENARFFVVGADVVFYKPWDWVENFYKKDPDPRANQVFIDQKNLSAYKFSADQAEIHVLDQDGIKAAMISALAAQNPKRLIIVQASHGAPGTGNQCYKTQASCRMDANFWVQVIKAIDEENLRKPEDLRLENLLFLPVSCFSKPLFDQILKSLGSPAGLSFNISAVSMQRCAVESNLNPIAMILNGEFNTSASSGRVINTKGFIGWAAAHSDWVKGWQDMKTLEDAVALGERLLSTAPRREIRHLPSGSGPATVSLKDFLLIPGIRAAYDKDILKPGGLSVAQILDKTVPPALKNNVRELSFELGKWLPEENALVQEITGRKQIDLSDKNAVPDITGVVRVVVRFGF